MNKTLLSIIFVLSAVCTVTAQDSKAPLWLRYSAISPDGQKIAFSYKGDIYTVAATGGRAEQITTHPAQDTRPVWSPDGKTIAFASNREGSFDVYIVPAQGGEPKRLTTHSANEYPVAFRDATHILFAASIQRDADDSDFPAGQFTQVYETDTNGSRPVMFSSIPMENISFDASGKYLLYNDYKGYEDPWRKHHRSAITRDIWLEDLSDGGRTFRKITSFSGEDRNPVWARDGKSFYYLSEQDSTFNVYKKQPDGSPVELTRFKNHPVRFLTASNNDLLCFTWNGEIYTLREGQAPVKVKVDIVTDNQENKDQNINFSNGATELELSPGGKEIVFVVRGDVFVSSVEYGTTRRVTNTPDQERDVSFSPDGRSIIYASERNGRWNLYRTSLVRKADKQFLYAAELKEEQLTYSDKACFQPLYSPDGNYIAYLEDRTALMVMDVKTGNTVTALDGKFNYSYSDGDQWFRWSPDSKWLISNYIGIGGWHSADMALVKADGSGQITNLTESGYTDSQGRFVLDGKAMLWFSDRAGYRSHGSWGAYDDAYLMFFDREAFDKFKMSKEELAQLDDSVKTTDKKDDEQPSKISGKKEKSDKKNDVKKKEPTPLQFDLDNRRDRIVRLTPNSSSISDAYLNKKGDKLYYLTSFEKGNDLWEYDLKENTAKILLKDAGGNNLLVDKDEKNFIILADNQIKKVEMASGKVTPVTMKAQFDYRPEGERDYIFEHVWKQVKDKFYVADLHQIDWEGYRKNYERFLPYINNNFDFTEMLSEMLGELNGSHTGARFYASSAALPTACLGAFFDDTYQGDGLLVKEVINQGPLTISKSNVKTGSIILKIDGTPIGQGKDYYPMLAGKANKKVLITYKDTPAGKEQELWIKPISAQDQNELLYKRWVEQRRQMVEKLSGGRLGYVHIRAMNSSSFRDIYSDILGRYRNKEAIVVDTRHNGGGWLHDDVITLLNAKEYQRFTPRGNYIGSDPYNKWTKPSIMLVCEDNYSNAHGVPWLYKELGVGKLVGTPMAGTMTAVWWERQIDPSIVFGIPQVAVQDMRGNYLENQELKPDIEVYNDPASVLKGKDLQLEKAVEELLKQVTK